MIKIKNFCKGVQGKKLYIATEWRRSRFCYAEFTRLAAAVNELASFTDGDSRDATEWRRSRLRLRVHTSNYANGQQR